MLADSLQELYQQLIIDHSRQPRHFGTLATANHIKEGFNPLCGDKLTLYILEKNGIIEDVRFEGCGCAISMASASLMSEQIQSKTVQEARVFFHYFHDTVMGDTRHHDQLGKLAVFAGVAAYPARVKCATLCWHTLCAALENNPNAVSTE